MEWIYLLYVIASAAIFVSVCIYSVTDTDTDYRLSVQLYLFGIVLFWFTLERYIPFWSEIPDLSYLWWIVPSYIAGMIVVFIINTVIIVYGSILVYKKNRESFINSFLKDHRASSFDADLLVRYNKEVRAKFFQFNRDYLASSVVMWPSFFLVHIGWGVMNVVKSLRFIGAIPERIIVKIISKKFNEIQ